jgi:hypothetical protein
MLYLDGMQSAILAEFLTSVAEYRPGHIYCYRNAAQGKQAFRFPQEYRCVL